MRVSITTEDGSLILERKVVYFSYERFVKDIVQGNRCFMCGANPELVPFNDEHVLPDWILRRYNLHRRVITLPNQTQFRYGYFRIPCCQSCNSKLGELIEKPMQELFDNGYSAFFNRLKLEGPRDLFCWMCLIFLKTHLKDTGLAMHQDKRKGTQKIGELHSWADLHHIHCIARSFYTDFKIMKDAIGSLVVLPAKILPYLPSFDYCDLSFAQTMLLRIDGIAVIAVLNDSNSCRSVVQELLEKIDGPLSHLQLREFAANMAAINIHLAERPTFWSGVHALTGEYGIGAEAPSELALLEWKNETLGTLVRYICGHAMPEYDGKSQILENLKTGRFGFLLNEKGQFWADHMD